MKKKLKKSDLKKIILILGIVLFLFVAYTGIKYYTQGKYQEGASKAVDSLIREQTNSDKIFVYKEGEVVKIPFEDFCENLNKSDS